MPRGVSTVGPLLGRLFSPEAGGGLFAATYRVQGPLDDPAVYQLFSAGNTTAVFQSESRSAKDLEKKLKPDNFEDIIALMALNRPGPLGSGMVDDFIARKKEQSQTGQGKAEWYFHPKLESTLKSTYGVIVYQEQVMLVAQLVAFLASDAAGYINGAYHPIDGGLHAST